MPGSAKGRFRWSPELVEKVERHYKTTTDEALARLVGATASKVYHKLRQLGLRRKDVEYSDDELLAYHRSIRRSSKARFPHGFFRGQLGEARLAQLVRVVLTRDAGIPVDEIPTRLTADALGELGLAAPLSTACGQSPFGAAELAWPGRWHPWEFGAVPNRFWSGPDGKDNGCRAIRWLVEEKLALTVDALPSVSLDSLFADNGLSGLLKAFDGSAIQAVVATYPDRFSPWDFRGSRYDEARRESVLEKIRALFEGVPEEEIPKRASKKLFKQHGLESDITKLFDGSPWMAVNAAFPERFQRWQFSSGRHIWSGDDRIEHLTEATRWLVEKRLELHPRDAPQRLRQDDFTNAGLGGMLNQCPELNGSYVRAFQLTYPNVAEVWEFRYAPRGTYRGASGREVGKAAVRWMVERSGLDVDELPRTVSRAMFGEAGLGAMLEAVFRGSPGEACLAAYPGRFRAWEFPNRRGIWRGKAGAALAAEATRWLVEEKLGLGADSLPEKLRVGHFQEHGLGGMLCSCPAIKGSIYEAACLAYPDAGYEREQFQGLRIEIALGLALERITLELFRSEGLTEGTDFRYDRLFSGCSHKAGCKPDFAFRDGDSWTRRWADCKLHWYTFYNGDAARYLEHCEKLTIIYLDEAEHISPMGGVEFVPVRTRFAHLRTREPELFAELDQLSQETIPDRFRDDRPLSEADVPGWSQIERDHVRKRAAQHTGHELAEQLGKSRSAVYNFARRMGYELKSDGFWNEERDEFLRSNFTAMTNPAMAEELGPPCTDKMVTQRLKKLGLKRPKKWTAETEGFLRANFRKMSNAELAEALEVTPRAVAVRLSRLGLRRG